MDVNIIMQYIKNTLTIQQPMIGCCSNFFFSRLLEANKKGAKINMIGSLFLQSLLGI